MQSSVETISLEDEWPTRIAPCERFGLRCPDCEGGVLVLRESKTYGLYYGCCRSECRGYLTANKDGSPHGIAADAETRKWRRLAHQTFDHLWQGEDAPMTRAAAYLWMTTRLGIIDTKTIGDLDREKCERLVTLVKQSFPRSRTAYDRLAEESF